MVYWCLRLPPRENEREQVNLRYHSSKVEFLPPFFGGNRRHQIPFWNWLTFNKTHILFKIIIIPVGLIWGNMVFMKIFNICWKRVCKNAPAERASAHCVDCSISCFSHERLNSRNWRALVRRLNLAGPHPT